ncbi:MAG: alpha/beta hydrolase [Verrucomicrobiota bacterium]
MKMLGYSLQAGQHAPMRTLLGLIAVVLWSNSSWAAESISSHEAKVGGVQMHYLQAGHGPAILLLHGFAQTSLMWRPLMPLLADKFTVIAPDLPGIGDSSIPTDGIDMKTAARRIHDLIRSLKIEKARVAGHDIGLMVAYAYATQFPDETEKLALMDAFLPGVPGWEAIYNNPHLWHFRFNGDYPEELVKGRERIYFDYFWNVFAADKTKSIPETDRRAYLEAYSKPGRMRAAWTYFASWPDLAKDFAQLSQTKLTIPVLALGGESGNGAALGEQAKLVATNPSVIVLPDAGHWIMEEKPKETMDALVKFLKE